MRPPDLTLAMTLILDFQVKFWNSNITGMGGTIDINKKEWQMSLSFMTMTVTKVTCKDLFTGYLTKQIILCFSCTPIKPIE